jgi:putative transposase
MKVIRSIKFRIYPKKQQTKTLIEWLGLHCDLYNSALSERIEHYRRQKQNIFGYITEKVDCASQAKQLPEIKKDRPEYVLLGSQALQNTLKKLDKAYQNFFRRIKQGQTPGFPRFKSKQRYDSFCYPGTSGWRIKNLNKKSGILNISNLGDIKFRGKARIDFSKGKLKTLTIKRTHNRWFTTICVEYEEELLQRKVNEHREPTGLDGGVVNTITKSDGTEIKNPRFLKQYEKKKKYIQRLIYRKKKGSNNRKKTIKKLNNLTYKFQNKKKDFQDKLTSDLVKQHDVIIVEDLKLKNMTKSASGTIEKHGKNVKQKSGLNRELLDASLGQIYSMLSYKAEEASSKYFKINPRCTSQMCSNCGFVSKENRKSQSLFICESCGFTCNADVNAAKNILNIGLKLSKSLETAGSVGIASGVVEVTKTMLKEEIDFEQKTIC